MRSRASIVFLNTPWRQFTLADEHPLVKDKPQILKRWVEYFKVLLNKVNLYDPITLAELSNLLLSSELNECPTVDEN